MFGWFSTVEQLVKTLQELANKITVFSDKLTTTLDGLVTKIEDLIENVSDEFDETTEPITVKAVTLDNGQVFNNALVFLDEGLLNIDVTDTNGVTKSYSTNHTFFIEH